MHQLFLISFVTFPIILSSGLLTHPQVRAPRQVPERQIQEPEEDSTRQAIQDSLDPPADQAVLPGHVGHLEPAPAPDDHPASGHADDPALQGPDEPHLQQSGVFRRRILRRRFAHHVSGGQRVCCDDHTEQQQQQQQQQQRWHSGQLHPHGHAYRAARQVQRQHVHLQHSGEAAAASAGGEFSRRS